MPIHCPIRIRDISKTEFDAIDRVVMRCSYAAQNTLGRLCDEKVYENDVSIRLRAEGFAEVHTQVPVTLTHQGFEKTYRLDLVADDALYELKTVEALAGEHDAQVMQYAMLVEVGHGKLINFRPPRVEGRLRFNALSSEARHQPEWDISRWQALSGHCDSLQNHARDIIRDWGTHLDVRLYEEALHFFCGKELRVPIVRDGHNLGSHRIRSHTEGAFFVVTALTRDMAQHEGHLRRLLEFTGYRGIQWLNLNHSRIQFITLV